MEEMTLRDGHVPASAQTWQGCQSGWRWRGVSIGIGVGPGAAEDDDKDVGMSRPRPRWWRKRGQENQVTGLGRDGDDGGATGRRRRDRTAGRRAANDKRALRHGCKRLEQDMRISTHQLVTYTRTETTHLQGSACHLVPSWD
ncbi:hypothetical protein EDB81DRAFT_494583 [Dactylonectria macrodidyma]|uniref:Uncharacterized protein n=1 Tax=Dactylonectria macrodidyma TaxID=307937 RepID=A0A9P9EXS0_9HYPO|nr:hypothetical protein EDB81DRAFT_494583 [Dactylonectria macrodidyma]